MVVSGASPGHVRLASRACGAQAGTGSSEYSPHGCRSRSRVPIAIVRRAVGLARSFRPRISERISEASACDPARGLPRTQSQSRSTCVWSHRRRGARRLTAPGRPCADAHGKRVLTIGARELRVRASMGPCADAHGKGCPADYERCGHGLQWGRAPTRTESPRCPMCPTDRSRFNGAVRRRARKALARTNSATRLVARDALCRRCRPPRPRRDHDDRASLPRHHGTLRPLVTCSSRPKPERRQQMHRDAGKKLGWHHGSVAARGPRGVDARRSTGDVATDMPELL